MGRISDLDDDDLDSEIEWVISETGHQLLDDDGVSSEIANSNADGWGLDTFDIQSINRGAAKEDDVEVYILFTLTGKQKDDQPFAGTTINGEATVMVDADGNAEYEVVSAERELILDEEDAEANSIFSAPQGVQVLDIGDEIKRYFAKHPDKIYSELSPRKFEVLIADILKDLGFETELTSVTRDGGRDIYAYIRNQVTSFLTFVECKKWSHSRKVGIEVVQRVCGAAKMNSADKSMIVTTSFFSKNARDEHAKVSSTMELTDFNGLKEWLTRYS